MAIKSTLVTPPNKAKEIDWDKPQIVETQLGTIVLPNGIHTDRFFSGTVLSSKEYPIGTHDKDWVKVQFTPITTPITITFENE